MAAKKKITTQKKAGFGVQILTIVGALAAVLMIQSTTVLAAGMIPTPCALLIDRTKGRCLTISVGAMNLAGCMPFLLDLWKRGHTMDVAIDIISQPLALVVMWSAAGMGYVIDWVVVGAVATMMYQKGQIRQSSILKRQKELIERWGPEIKGDIPLDERG